MNLARQNAEIEPNGNCEVPTKSSEEGFIPLEIVERLLGIAYM